MATTSSKRRIRAEAPQAPDRLANYRRKRNFNSTPEPAGARAPRRSATHPIFVVQKHDASQLHYDFRLEIDGALKSWAVPKGPSLDPGVKALAVHVEDHPLDYAGFEGMIPAGQYGAGTVMVWDKGRWTPDGDPREGYESGHLSFELHGDKLRGGWALVRMQGKAGKDGRNWLLIKKRDDHARPRREYDVLAEEPDSAATGRSLDEIAREEEPARARRRAKTPTKKGPAAGRARSPGRRSARPPARLDPSALAGAREACAPAFVPPQLATLVKDAPEGDDWLHEIKFDGYRLLCVLRDGEARLFTRRANDWTAKFPAIAEAAAKLPVGAAVLDGEAVALGPDGVSDFQALQNVFAGESRPKLIYYVFDILHADSFDLRRAPLAERKALLERLVLKRARAAAPAIAYSDHFVGHGPETFEKACRLGLEGIISKRADSPYTSGRTGAWLKVKCVRRQEFVIGGYTEPGGSRTDFGALLLGYHDKRGLVYAGRVGTGFTSRTLKRVKAALDRRARKSSPFVNPPRGYEARGVHWVRPELVGEVEFTGFTTDGLLRHPSFQGLREDKPAEEVVREEPRPTPSGAARSSKKRARAGSSANGRARAGPSAADADVRIAGVRISNPDRVVFPDAGLTKRAVAEHYERVAEWILPHVAGRPLAVVRCPTGLRAACFFQRHVVKGMPDAVRAVMIKEKDGRKASCIVIDDVAGLVSLAQFGVIELHPWACRADNVERPDLLTFDLDPGPGVEWKAVARAAGLVRKTLAELGLKSFLKTSGGKGLHVVAPVARRSTWSAVAAYTRAVAERIAAGEPERYTATMSKAKRKGRIFIDYLRNQRAATSIAPWSLRARAGAPVSTPLRWEELLNISGADAFTAATIADRLASLKRDPWEGLFDVRQSITKRMLSRVAKD